MHIARARERERRQGVAGRKAPRARAAAAALRQCALGSASRSARASLSERGESARERSGGAPQRALCRRPPIITHPGHPAPPPAPRGGAARPPRRRHHTPRWPRTHSCVSTSSEYSATCPAVASTCSTLASCLTRERGTHTRVRTGRAHGRVSTSQNQGNALLCILATHGAPANQAW